MHAAPEPGIRIFDVIVVGGGAAGLSAALTLGRSRRSVLVVDAGEPRNAPADAMHTYLSRDGTPPAELLKIGRAEVEHYGVEVRSGRVTRAARSDGRLSVTLEDGGDVHARRLIVTTGLIDELPPIEGLAERWGRDVVHCPYCHGWEVRDRVIGVLATTTMAVHHAGLFRQLSDRVVLLRHRGPELTADERASLTAREIDVIDGEVVAVEVRNDAMAGVRLRDGRRVALEALAVASRMVARAEVLAGLGLKAIEHPSGMGTHVPADAMGATEIPGVWVAGNVTDPGANVIVAAAQGTRAGAAVNADLVAEDTALAVQATG